MQDRYVGDIGDFANNGLLRWLCGIREETSNDGHGHLPLGVVWCLSHPVGLEALNNDGGRINYLIHTVENLNNFRLCDIPLYDTLASLVARDTRNVGALANSGILGRRGTQFYDHETSLAYPREMGLLGKQQLRKDWVANASNAVKRARIVFLNPDTGISDKASGIAKGVARHGREGPKYVFLDDLRKFAEPGNSLIIYQHLGYGGTQDEQIRRIKETLDANFRMRSVRALHFKCRGTGRAYFVLSRPDDVNLYEKMRLRINSFCNGPWGRHFNEIQTHAR